MIHITREPSYADGGRNYLVELDGVIIGKIGPKQSKAFEIEPGTHTLRLKIDWGGSNTIKFNARTQDNLHFRGASSLKGAKVFLAIIYAIFLPNKYIELERID